MGSGDWFKTIISRKKTKPKKSKKTKDSASVQSNESKRASQTSDNLECSGSCRLKIVGVSCAPDENAAATHIQSAFRRYKARKILHSLRVAEKLKAFTLRHSVQKQASTTLSYLQSWNKSQTQIAARRHSMVVESRLRQKKIDSQLKLEAKLHDLEVEWCGGSETREEVLAKIHQREEAAVKRERAMAYAFSHQWRANSGMSQNNFVYEFGKGNWGWSWTERWIASRPWESKLPVQSTSPSKVQTKARNKLTKIPNASSADTASTRVKPTASDGKRPSKGLPISTAEKTGVTEASSKPVKETTP